MLNVITSVMKKSRVSVPDSLELVYHTKTSITVSYRRRLTARSLTRTNVSNGSEMRSYTHVLTSDNKNMIKIFCFTFSLNLHTKIDSWRSRGAFVNHTQQSNPIKLQRLHTLNVHTFTYISTHILQILIGFRIISESLSI